jgi:hypothetical protein
MRSGIGEMKNPCRFLVGNMTGRGQLVDLEVDGRIILECVTEK